MSKLGKFFLYFGVFVVMLVLWAKLLSYDNSRLPEKASKPPMVQTAQTPVPPIPNNQPKPEVNAEKNIENTGEFLVNFHPEYFQLLVNLSKVIGRYECSMDLYKLTSTIKKSKEQQNMFAVQYAVLYQTYQDYKALMAKLDSRTELHKTLLQYDSLFQSLLDRIKNSK